MSGGGGAPKLGSKGGRLGRPPGATARRSKDLKGYVDARFGGSAAQQSAQLALVTPAELKAAGGSMAKAQVAKALDLVEHVRRAQEGRDAWLREVVREELRGLAGELGADLVKAMERAVKRISEAASGFGLKEALKLISDERAALLPYTDQRQPLAIDVAAKLDQSSVILLGAAPAELAGGPAVEKAEVFEGVFAEVAQSKSHAGPQPIEQARLFGPDAPD